MIYEFVDKFLMNNLPREVGKILINVKKKRRFKNI